MVGAAVAVTAIVDDSMTTEPSDVTCDDCVKVVVVTTFDASLVAGALETALEAGTEEGATDDALEPPVERLTCLFSILAKASSIP